MAENKKSFQLYTDLIDFVNGSNVHGVEIEPMTDEEAGQLFRWILEYVNDLHPKIPNKIKYAVVQVKRQLDSDLESWKKQCEVNRKNGALGGRPRKPKETEQNQIGFQETHKNPQKPDKDKDKDKDISVSKDTSNNKNTNVFSAEMTKNVTLTLPTIVSPKGNEYPIFEEDIKKWQDVYVGVDVLTELKKMKLWLEANPKSKKTFNGIPRFVNSWLSREQDKASRNMQNKQVAYFEDDNGGFQSLDETDEEYKLRMNGGFHEI